MLGALTHGTLNNNRPLSSPAGQMRSAWTSSKRIEDEPHRQPTRPSIAFSYATTSMRTETQHWWLIHDPVVDGGLPYPSEPHMVLTFRNDLQPIEASTVRTVGTLCPIRCCRRFSPFSSTAFNETPNAHAAITIRSILCLAHHTRGLAQAGQY
ncbi:hypothetical protein ASPFODRAFT_556182 [Aspergillus luchuensis CBS 106.47]|uniref:Uncharacterized protein n=1 Tax=Aspergillus luchuensis (strain CBS 106.47) TaxID=1137211 RepID=A0A1M3SYX2_ASPLC|nr:hypothetical protein ASPFODRAFT_556182 [Aspergillus luchuensis CBS 106.47]